ncbi:MAG: hypothetical protein N2Z79_03715 [Candidatus Omnitrophica bacterium]|nr:hypothetical protein [Candidatus Omnitrophota bacterium]
MKKGLFNVLLVAMLILSSSLYSFAEDTYSFKIGCVIPKIPGVNAPLEEKTEYISQENISQLSVDTELKDKNSAEKNKESLSLEEKIDGFILKTYYSR